jgi:hypothetical protein
MAGLRLLKMFSSKTYFDRSLRKLTPISILGLSVSVLALRVVQVYSRKTCGRSYNIQCNLFQSSLLDSEGPVDNLSSKMYTTFTIYLPGLSFFSLFCRTVYVNIMAHWKPENHFLADGSTWAVGFVGFWCSIRYKTGVQHNFLIDMMRFRVNFSDPQDIYTKWFWWKLIIRRKFIHIF